MQIFREPFGITETLNVSNLYGGKDINNLTFEHGMYHKIAIELALFEGERAEVTSGAMAQRSMGGMREFISTNTKDFGGVPTWEEIVKQAQKEFRYGNQEVRKLFAAPAVTSAISFIAKDYIRTAPPAKTFGIKMDRFTAQHGDYILIKENLFADGEELTKVAFSLDMDNIAYVPLNQRDTKLNKNIQANDADAVKHEWLTECTMRRSLEKTHGLWTNAA